MTDDWIVQVRHMPATTLEALDALDTDEMVAGHLSAQRGDPEPGMNHTAAFHHGWRTRMMDLGELEIPIEHRSLVKLWLNRSRRITDLEKSSSDG